MDECPIWGESLYYAYYDVSTWQYETVDSPPGACYHTSLALDSSDNAHISYYDSTSGDLKYATNASGSWVTETVDNIANYLYSSLALDSSDKAHISYYRDGMATGDLKYATNASGSWVIETVDNVGDEGYVGRYTSLGLDSSDKVHISYEDLTNGDLKYARSIVTIDDILEFFDQSVEDGTLEGSGRPWPAKIRLLRMRIMLKFSAILIKTGNIELACWELQRACDRCDGGWPPPDSVEGEASPELAEMILELMESLGCE